MEIFINHVTGLIAPKGTGKTYEVCQIIKSMSRVAVFDTLQESQYGLIASNVIFGSPRELAAELALPDFHAVYRTVFTDSGFEHFVKLCYLQGKMTMVIEETDHFCSPYGIPEPLRVAVNYGRHRELSIIYVTRRFAAIHRDLTFNTNRMIFFNMTEPRDLDAIADRCGAEVADAVSNLRRLSISNSGIVPGEKLIWNDTGEYHVERNGESSEVPGLQSGN